MNTSVSDQPQTMGAPVMLKSRREIEEDIARRLRAERERLEQSAGLRAEVQHFQRPAERAFTAAERDRVTVLIGGLTWKHERLIKSVFQSAGYKVEIMPTPDVP